MTITVKQLIEILSKFDPDLEVWEGSETGYFPMDPEPEEGILEDYDIPNTDYISDIGKKVVKFVY